MRKKDEKPINIEAYDDLKKIVGYHPCQKIQFCCEKCGKNVIKSLSAVKKRGLLCTKCQRDNNGIKKYGSEENFKSHLKCVRKKMISTLIEKHGSYEEVINNRLKNYKKTCLERYGVDNTSKRENFKEFFKKNNPIFNEIYKEKAKLNYTQEKHKIAASKIAEYMKQNDLYALNVKKCAETKFKKYGDSAFTNHEQSEATMLSKYGVKCGFNIAIQQKNNHIENDGYIKISDLSIKYGYYEEGIVTILEKINIPIKKYGNWRCVLKNLIPNDFDKIIHNYAFSHRSNGEKEMFDFVSNLDENAINNDRSILKPKELDILIPNKKIAIEFDGLFWHKDDNLLIKTNQCKKKGIQLLHFYEDEWEYKKDICKSIIASKLGIFNERFYARQCEVKEISNDEYNDFLNINHIQGSINTPIRLGLFFQNELVQCIGLGKSRFSKNEFELYRMCTKLNSQVIGGFSKLLKHVKALYKIDSLYAYVDKRLFNGDSLKKIGFSQISETKPSYFYFKNFNRENRVKYQKHKLKNILPNFDENLSEFENMKNNGFSRIYDCGAYKMQLKMNE